MTSAAASSSPILQIDTLRRIAPVTWLRLCFDQTRENAGQELTNPLASNPYESVELMNQYKTSTVSHLDRAAHK